MTYLHHVTITTGHSRISPRHEVDEETISLLAPWLNKAVEAGKALPLPVQSLSHFSMLALVEQGALVCSLYGPAGPYAPGQPAAASIPIVTFAVAQRSRHGVVWDRLVGQFDAAPGLVKPQEPWCAVVLHPSAAAYLPDVADWVGDFERCVAWTWITPRPAPEAV